MRQGNTNHVPAREHVEPDHEQSPADKFLTAEEKKLERLYGEKIDAALKAAGLKPAELREKVRQNGRGTLTRDEEKTIFDVSTKLLKELIGDQNIVPGSRAGEYDGPSFARNFMVHLLTGSTPADLGLDPKWTELDITTPGQVRRHFLGEDNPKGTLQGLKAMGLREEDFRNLKYVNEIAPGKVPEELKEFLAQKSD